MRNRREAALKAWKTIRSKKAFLKARAASKEAFKAYCEEQGWKVAFFEGKNTRAPRAGIIDAVAFNLDRGNADGLKVRLIQLKGGNGASAGASWRG